MRYEILGETLPVVICQLEGGEKHSEGCSQERRCSRTSILRRAAMV